MVITMSSSNEIKFFDVECAYGRAYDLKELRRILMKVIGYRVKNVQVFRTRKPVEREVARVVVDLHDDTDVNFRAIQRKELTNQGLILHEVAADGTAVSLLEPELPEDTVSPTTIPVAIITATTSSIPLAVQVPKPDKRFWNRRSPRRTAA